MTWQTTPERLPEQKFTSHRLRRRKIAWCLSSLLSRKGRHKAGKMDPSIFCPAITCPEIFVSANFFMRIQKYLRPHIAYTNRIRPSTRIRFVSGHLKELVNRARAEKDWFWYCDVSVYKNIRIRASTRIWIHSVFRNFHSGERIQKSPDTPSVYGGHVWTLGVTA